LEPVTYDELSRVMLRTEKQCATFIVTDYD